MRRLGIFGGTFNPIHIAHLMLAEDVREEFSLQQVLFIPTNLPPHKRVEGMIDAAHRLEMVRLATQNNPHFRYEDIELQRGGFSYTVDTVDYLYKEYTIDGKPYLIIGSDLVTEIETWREIGSLMRKVYFIVLMRGTSEIEENSVFSRRLQGSSWYSYGKRKVDITSSEIRERVKKGLSIRYLVPEPVLEYIKENALYQNQL